jgi:hypothetical protein
MVILHALTALSLALQAPAQVSPAPPVRDEAMVATAHRATAAPVIDGSSADAVWQTARRTAGFVQFDPKDGAAPTHQTEFQVAFDDRNLYVFVRAFDPHPDSIMHALTRRDVRGPSDQIKIMIDSYNDNRSGFEMAINPDGVKRDFSMFNDGNEDDSWNGVWDAEARVDSLGWTAEFRIPLSQLRYADRPVHTFGFGVWRDIERYRERSSWPRYQPTKNGLVSQLGDLEGIEGIRSPGTFELLPYTVTKNIARLNASGVSERQQELSVGADLKYGITSNITLNATINPDFGQVESDPAVVNLSAFETFLRERRPFFVEGTGLYQFRLNCYIVVDCGTNEGLFYSRRIGRSPSLLGTYGDARTRTSTPIAAAAKLTGRTKGGLSFGMLDALTPSVDGTQDRTVEPTTNYTVLSAQQDLRGGNTGISVIGTAVNRSMDAWTSPYLHEAAYAGGASFRNKMGGGKYELNASVTASHVVGTPEAIARTQRSAVHYFQQPDDDIELKPNATSLSGHSAQIKFGKYGGGITRIESSLVHMSPGFEVNDLGYLRRADIIDWSTWGALSFRTQKWIYNWAQVNGNHWERWNTSGLRLENAFNANGHIGLKNNWNFHLGGTVDGIGETYCDRCTRGGPALRREGGFYPWGGVNGDSRKKIIPYMWFNYGRWDGGRSNYLSLSPSLDLRFSTRFTASLGANFNETTDNTQWFGNFTEGDVTHHTFAHLEQRTVSMNVRINYTARPNLTLEFYGEPFATSGTYSDVRELSAAPDAKQYVERFQPFAPPASANLGFNYIQMRTNTVARWEYKPGSTVFLVWAHGRQRSASQQDGTWRDDYRDLFELHPDNTFLIKVAYWLSR